MIFLDTNVISYFFAGDQKVTAKLLKADANGTQICTTAITVYEILKDLKWKSNHALETRFKAFLQDVSVFVLDDASIDIASGIYADLRKKGIAIGDADILIAAIVVRHDGTLVSHNTRHFSCVPRLRLENWQ